MRPSADSTETVTVSWVMESTSLSSTYETSRPSSHAVPPRMPGLTLVMVTSSSGELTVKISVSLGYPVSLPQVTSTADSLCGDGSSEVVSDGAGSASGKSDSVESDSASGSDDSESPDSVDESEVSGPSGGVDVSEPVGSSPSGEGLAESEVLWRSVSAWLSSSSWLGSKASSPLSSTSAPSSCSASKVSCSEGCGDSSSVCSSWLGSCSPEATAGAALLSSRAPARAVPQTAALRRRCRLASYASLTPVTFHAPGRDVQSPQCTHDRFIFITIWSPCASPAVTCGDAVSDPVGGPAAAPEAHRSGNVSVMNS